MFQLQRRSDADRHLHAIAFIADQHRRLQDPTIDILLSDTQSFRSTVDRQHMDEVFAQRKVVGFRLGEMLDAVDTEGLSLRQEIRALLDHETMSDARKLAGIKAVLDRDRENAADDEGVFQDILEHRSIRLQNRNGPILRRVEFVGDASVTDLMAALACFREKDGSIGPGMPMAFRTTAERDAVSNGPKGFRESLCKVFLFQHVAAAIKAGSLNLEGSFKYRPLDKYLIGRE